MGIFKLIDSENDMSTRTIVERIIANAKQYMIRNERKEKKELELLKNMIAADRNNNINNEITSPN